MLLALRRLRIRLTGLTHLRINEQGVRPSRQVAVLALEDLRHDAIQHLSGRGEFPQADEDITHGADGVPQCWQQLCSVGDGRGSDGDGEALFWSAAFVEDARFQRQELDALVDV